jgi:hypothetical protein
VATPAVFMGRGEVENHMGHFYQEHPYSPRSNTIGSTLAARRAGI